MNDRLPVKTELFHAEWAEYPQIPLIREVIYLRQSEICVKHIFLNFLSNLAD